MSAPSGAQPGRAEPAGRHEQGRTRRRRLAVAVWNAWAGHCMPQRVCGHEPSLRHSQGCVVLLDCLQLAFALLTGPFHSALPPAHSRCTLLASAGPCPTAPRLLSFWMPPAPSLSLTSGAPRCTPAWPACLPGCCSSLCSRLVCLQSSTFSSCQRSLGMVRTPLITAVPPHLPSACGPPHWQVGDAWQAIDPNIAPVRRPQTQILHGPNLEHGYGLQYSVQVRCSGAALERGGPGLGAGAGAAWRQASAVSLHACCCPPLAHPPARAPCCCHSLLLLPFPVSLPASLPSRITPTCARRSRCISRGR
jgi:hypothetical protein